MAVGKPFYGNGSAARPTASGTKMIIVVPDTVSRDVTLQPRTGAHIFAVMGARYIPAVTRERIPPELCRATVLRR